MPSKPQRSELVPFSKRLKELIKEFDLEQKKLAEVADVRPATISGYLKAESQPAVLVLASWASEYRINLNWLIAGEGQMKVPSCSSAQPKESAPHTPMGQELDEIKQALQDVGATENEIKEAMLDYVSAGSRGRLKASSDIDQS